MAERTFFVGDTIKADGDYYNIIGKITFRNRADGKTWDEYRLRAVEYYNEERWLAVDNFYNEFSLSRINPQADTLGYHVVDSGIEQVIAVSGDVGDVMVGDTASFEEYEDAEEERIVSIENWDDGPEYSSGYYLDPWEFGKDGENMAVQRMKSGNSILLAFIVILTALFVIVPGISEYLAGNKKIEKYLKKDSSFQYVTSITGAEKQKANVYEYIHSSPLREDALSDAQLKLVAENIISGVNGNTDSIQQNTEDDDQTIAILTDKEYCIIYRGEDDKIYVQVSTRKYTYTSDKEPYHSRRSTHRYYRRFYYSTGYSSDSSTYSGSQSSFGGYSDGTISYNSGNDLNSYSNTVRQSSVGSRSSDGGGLSSGK
jgi:hypothetical protein